MSKTSHTEKANAMLKRAGYAMGGATSFGNAMSHGHGIMKGPSVPHLARGGAARHGKHTQVNVIVPPAGGAGGPPAMRPPIVPPGGGGPVAAGLPPPGARPMPPPGAMPPGAGLGGPPGPPPGGPPPGAIPPGALPPRPGMPPPGMMPPRKRGGAVNMTAGAGGGKGRLEKIKAYGRK